MVLCCFVGEYCNRDINECEYPPCHNGAQCNNTFGSYECICRPGYGGEDCKLNINECASGKRLAFKKTVSVY